MIRHIYCESNCCSNLASGMLSIIEEIDQMKLTEELPKKKPEEGDFDDDRCKRSVSFEGWLDIDTKERGKVGDKLKCRFVHCLIYTSRLGIKNYFNTKSFFMLQNKFI